jgi:hypothetical protein
MEDPRQENLLPYLPDPGIFAHDICGANCRKRQYAPTGRNMSATEGRYAVELMETLVNDLGEMSETQLFGYLRNRLLLDHTPEQVLSELAEKDQITVRFGSNLAPGKITIVRIRKVQPA